MTGKLTIAIVLIAFCIAGCDSSPPAPVPPQPETPGPVAMAYLQGDRFVFADANGAARASTPAGKYLGTPIWAADNHYFAWLEESRLHIIDSATGTDNAQPCPCSGLDRHGDGFASVTSAGDALLLFTAATGQAKRIPLAETLPYATLAAGGRTDVAVSAPLPEEQADYRGQSRLLAVDERGNIRPMTEGPSRVSFTGSALSPDSSRLVMGDAPSSGACWSVASFYELSSAGPNPAGHPTVPDDEPFTRAVLREKRVYTDIGWAGDAVVVTFGPGHGCQNILPARYLTYSLSAGRWQFLRSGALSVAFGSAGRTYAIELGGDISKISDGGPVEGKLVVVKADGTRLEISEHVSGLWATPAEQAAGHPSATPPPDTRVLTTDHGQQLEPDFQGLATRITAALSANDSGALAELCAHCDAPTKALLQSPQGRDKLLASLRAHPAQDANSATYPGLAVSECTDQAVNDKKPSCTIEQINDVGALGLKTDIDGDSLTEVYRAATAGSIHLARDQSGTAFWAGQSTSARDYLSQGDLTEPQYFFMSPDGTYYCGFNKDSAACQGPTAPVPPRPDSCSEGPTWGYGLGIDKGKVDFTCAGDVIFYPIGHEPGERDRLAAGQTISAVGFTCTAQDNGVSCRQDATGHGFFITRDTNKIF